MGNPGLPGDDGQSGAPVSYSTFSVKFTYF